MAWAFLCAVFGLGCDLELPPANDPPTFDVPRLDVPRLAVPALDAPELSPGIGWPTDCRCTPPVELQADLLAAARRHPEGPSACDLACQTYVESTYRCDAVSPAGALGCIQCMPATCDELGIDPWDPGQAFRGMARYMAWCRSGWTPALGGRTDADLYALALCCYNYGRGACFRSQARHGWILWLEAAPVLPEETRNYVARIRAGHK